MKKNALAILVLAFLTFHVNGPARAADMPAAVASTTSGTTTTAQRNSDWVPPGFESLNEPQITEIDLYYGSEFLTSVFARFTQQRISILDSDAITQLLRNVRDPESINLILQKPFSTNSSAICHSEFQTDCGTLQPETVDLIFDRNILRADLFINPELLLAGQALQNRFLPESSSDFSVFSDNAIFFSGIDGEQTTYNLVNTTRIAMGESRLLMRNNLTDEQGFTVDTLALQKEFQGKDYQLGLIRGNASSFSFMRSEQFVGASMASSLLTRTDLDQSLGTEIELFFGSRSRVEILREDMLLASGYYDVGNQIIDTSMLPPGSYDIEMRITDSGGAMTTEHRFFSKTSKLPPDDQSLYFVQLGNLAIRNEDTSIPEMGPAVLRAGFSKRLTPSLGADVGVSATPDSTMFQAGVFKMGKSYELKTELAMEDNGAIGADINLRWDLDFIRLNINSRKVWEGDTLAQLGENQTQSSVSLSAPSKFGSFGLFARTNKRGDGIDSKNYGLRWQANSFSAAGGMLTAGIEVSKNEDDLLAMFSMSYRFNGKTSQHAFTPAVSYESFAADGYKQARFQGSHLSSWVSGDRDQRRLSLRADQNTQSSFEARFEDSRRIGDTDMGIRYTMDKKQLEYGGKLSTSFGYTRDGSGFSGRPRGDSAFIISVDGVPDATEFDVMINGSARGRTLSGKRLLIPVSPYETYRVELNPIGDNIIDIDDKTYRKTVYPGNVVSLNWNARIIKIIIGRIVDEKGEPLQGALIRNVKGFGVTDNQGFFQAEIDESIKSLIIQKDIRVCEADFEIKDSSKKVISLGTLSCIETDDPIVRRFQEFYNTPLDVDLAEWESAPAGDTAGFGVTETEVADFEAISVPVAFVDVATGKENEGLGKNAAPFTAEPALAEQSMELQGSAQVLAPVESTAVAQPVSQSFTDLGVKSASARDVQPISKPGAQAAAGLVTTSGDEPHAQVGPTPVSGVFTDPVSGEADLSLDTVNSFEFKEIADISKIETLLAKSPDLQFERLQPVAGKLISGLQSINGTEQQEAAEKLAPAARTQTLAYSYNSQLSPINDLGQANAEQIDLLSNTFINNKITIEIQLISNKISALGRITAARVGNQSDPVPIAWIAARKPGQFGHSAAPKSAVPLHTELIVRQNTNSTLNRLHKPMINKGYYLFSARSRVVKSADFDFENSDYLPGGADIPEGVFQGYDALPRDGPSRLAAYLLEKSSLVALADETLAKFCVSAKDEKPRDRGSTVAAAQGSDVNALDSG